MNMKSEIYRKLFNEDLKEGENSVTIECKGEEMTIKYILTISGEYIYASDYIISEPDSNLELIEATTEDEDGNIIKLEI